MARILLDMDGVLCDLIGKWFAIYNKEHHDHIDLSQMSEWEPHLYAKKGKAIYHYLSQPGFFRDLSPIPGAIEGVKQLLNEGFDVVIVTAAKTGQRDKMQWVKEHLPFLDTRNVIFAHRKELVRGDVLFDDAPHNLVAFAPYGIAVAMAYPYNQTYPGHRVRSWDEFLTLAHQLFPRDESTSTGQNDLRTARSTSEVVTESLTKRST
jgi:5'-nucleotidase